MNQLKVGDVVYLNSQDGVEMTVAEISDNGVECIYFNTTDRRFVRTIPMPADALTKVKKLD